MRVVEQEKNTTSIAYRGLQALAVIGGVFSFVICILLIVNNLSIRSSDPIHLKALEERQKERRGDPKNEAIKLQIRELDYVARRAFFTSQHFNHMGIYFLVGGLVVTIASYKTLEAYRQPVPYPDSSDPKDDLIDDARWARQSITTGSLVLIGFALYLALTDDSPLDRKGSPEPLKGTSTKSAPGKGTPDKSPPALASLDEMRQNWPILRGMDGGIASPGELPMDWNGTSGDGITWKTAVPLPGFSSPIVWKNRIFLTGADQEAREVYCFDSQEGKLLWTHKAENIPGSPNEPPEVTEDTGHAASTMTTDGVRVFAIFSTGDLVALDMEGKRVWAKNLGKPEKPYGHSSSLVRFKDVLLIQYDQDEGSFVAGIDVATGKEKWKVERDFGPSWASPLLVNTGERNEVILSAETVVSYDPLSGKELWKFEWVEGGEIGSTPVFADGLLYLCCGHDRITVLDIKTQKVVWENEEFVPSACTPLVTGGLFFAGLDEDGIVCFDAKTGKGAEDELRELWLKETDTGFYSSPILAGNRIYLMDRAGMMHIFAPEKKFKSLGQPILGESAVCTPAVIGNAIYYRGTQHLYKISP